MSLAPGTLFGPCAILGPLGAGGMGEVLRARDTRMAGIADVSHFVSGGWLNAAALTDIEGVPMSDPLRRLFPLPVISGDGTLRDIAIAAAASPQ